MPNSWSFARQQQQSSRPSAGAPSPTPAAEPAADLTDAPVVEQYLPGTHSVDEVKVYADAHPDELEQILAAEQATKNRSTLVAWLQQVIAEYVEAEQAEAAGDDGTPDAP